jgi:hypothetical protein
VHAVHIPSPGPYEPRVNHLIDLLGSQPTDHQRIVAGDFNITVAIRQEQEALKNTLRERRIQQRRGRLCRILSSAQQRSQPWAFQPTTWCPTSTILSCQRQLC